MGCCSGEDDTDESKHGSPKKYDASFKGPIKNRGCTDILCCILFFVFILGYMVIGVFAWLNGDPIILLYPTDNQGRICGLNYGDLDLSNKTSVFYFDLTKCSSPATLINFQCPTTQICVNTCPSETWSYHIDALAVQAQQTSGLGSQQFIADGIDFTKYICDYNFDVSNKFVNDPAYDTIYKIIESGKCAPYYIPMTPVVGRCIPDVITPASLLMNNAEAVVDAANNTVNTGDLTNGSLAIKFYLEAREVGEKVFADFTDAWYYLLIAFGVSAVVAFVWIVIMRWVAGPMVWLSIIAIIALLTFGCYYTYTQYDFLKSQNSSDTFSSVGFTTDLDVYLRLTDTWLAFFIILIVIDVIIILLVIFLISRIRIAIQVIKMSSKAVGSMISTLFYPLVTFVLTTIVVAFWAATALFLASSGKPLYEISNPTNIVNFTNGDPCNITEWSEASHEHFNNDDIKCIFVNYGGYSLFHQNVLWLQIVALFGFFWLLNWVIALGQCTLAGAFASYYWAFRKPQDIPPFPLLAAFGRSLRYHTGSLAFGALIIAIIQIIRVMLEYLDHKLKGTENKAAKIIIKCCKCCFWCLEKIMKFLNRNAYIMIAVYGKNFCWSAKEAFKLLMRNIIRVAVIDKVTDFLLFIGKLLVTIGMGALSWAFLNRKITIFNADQYVPQLNYYWVLIIVIVVGTYIIAAGFFNTYAMAIDTVFLCFLEDLERNDGSEDKPYYMSTGLMKVLGKRNHN